MPERFAAPTPDDVFVAYVAGRLSPDGRRDVERWLDAEPAWQARLDAWEAIAGAVRDVPVDAPRADELLTAPPPPRPSRHHDRRWLLAAAAALALVVVAVGALIDRDSTGDSAGGDRTPVPTAGVAPGTTPDHAGEPDDDVGEAGPGDEPVLDPARRVIVRAVGDSRDQGTATFTVVLTADLDRPGETLPEQVLVAAGGSIEFRERVGISGSVRFEHFNPDAPDDFSFVESVGSTFVRCTPAGAHQPVPADGAPCLIAVGTTELDVEAVLDELERGAGDTEAVDAGRYEVTTTMTVGGEEVPVTLTVALRADGLLDEVNVVADPDMTVHLADGSVVEVPAHVDLTYDFFDFGVDVVIRDVD